MKLVVLRCPCDHCQLSQEVSRVEGVLETISFGHLPFEFSATVRQGRSGMVTVSLHTEVIDRDSFRLTPVVSATVVPEGAGADVICGAVFSLAREFLIHELLESMKVGGERYRDPHSPEFPAATCLGCRVAYTIVDAADEVHCCHLPSCA